jgi:hypothetical protein
VTRARQHAALYGSQTVAASQTLPYFAFVEQVSARAPTVGEEQARNWAKGAANERLRTLEKNNMSTVVFKMPAKIGQVCAPMWMLNNVEIGLFQSSINTLSKSVKTESVEDEFTEKSVPKSSNVEPVEHKPDIKPVAGKEAKPKIFTVKLSKTEQVAGQAKTVAKSSKDKAVHTISNETKSKVEPVKDEVTTGDTRPKTVAQMKQLKSVGDAVKKAAAEPKATWLQQTNAAKIPSMMVIILAACAYELVCTEQCTHVMCLIQAIHKYTYICLHILFRCRRRGNRESRVRQRNSTNQANGTRWTAQIGKTCENCQ